MKRINGLNIFFISTLIISFFILTDVSYATDYYVKNGGNDSASGMSDATAWATIAKVNDFAATGGFRSGDTLNFKRGSTWSNDETLGINGTDFYKNVITTWGTIDGFTIQDYGEGDLPKLDGTTQRPIYINASDMKNLMIKNLNCSGLGGGEWGALNVLLYYINGVTVDGLYIDGHEGATNYKYASGLLRLSKCSGNLEVKNCTLKNIYKDTYANTLADNNWLPNDANLMSVWYAEGSIKTTGWLKIHNNSFSNAYSDCIQIGGQYSTDGLYIYENTFSGHGEQALDFKSCAYVFIYHNDFSHNDFGLDPGGGAFAATGIVTGSGTRVWDQSLYYSKEFDIYENYFHDTKYVGIAATSTKERVYRNFFKDAGSALRINGNHGAFYDNIFYLTGEVSSSYFTVHKSAIYGENQSDNFYNLVYNNTIYINNPSYLYGIAWQGKSGQRGNIIKKNIIQVNNSSSSVYPLYIQDYDGSNTFPAIENNAWNNLHSSKRILRDGVEYNSDELTKWNTDNIHGEIFSDPMFTDAQAGDFSLREGSPCISPDMTIGASNLSLSAGLPKTSVLMSPPLLSPPKNLTIKIGLN